MKLNVVFAELFNITELFGMLSILVNEIYPTLNYSLWLYTVAFSGLIITLVFIYSDGNGF